MLCRTATVTIVSVLILSSLIIPLQYSSGQTSFSGDVLVSGYEPHQGDQLNPSIAVAPDGDILSVWEDHTGGIPRICFSISSDGGATWSEKIDVASSQPGAQRSPSVATDGNGTVYVVWVACGEMYEQIYLAKSNDSGATFTEPVGVSPPITGDQCNPDIAIAEGLIYVTWAEENITHLDIYMARSTDGGRSFEPARRMDDSVGDSIQNFPSIAAVDNKVLIAWHDSRDDQYLDIFAAWSNDSGTTFGPNFKVSDGLPGMRESRPDVSISPAGLAAIVWQEKLTSSGDFDIRMSVWNGTSFLPSVRVDDAPDGVDSFHPRVACDEYGNVSVVFMDNRAGYSHVFYTVSRDGGKSFTANLRVDSAPEEAGQGSPDLTLTSDSTPLVIFEDSRSGRWEIYFSFMINEPPICEVLSPSEGESLEGVVNITGVSHDPDGNDSALITTVRITGDWYDSDWITAAGGAEWWYLFNTTILINGEYLIQARCYDGKAYSQLVQLTVNVKNPEQPWPDLTVQAGNIKITPEKMEAGMQLLINATVENTGNETAENVEVRFYMGTVGIGSKTIASIPAGENATASVRCLAREGTFLITVKVDPDNNITELDEENNQAATQITVKPAGYYRPDLQITLADIHISPPDPAEDDVVEIAIEIWNAGRSDAFGVNVRLVIDGGIVKEDTLEKVTEQGSVLVNFNWTAIPGEHTFEIALDPGNTVEELNETNNNLTFSLDVPVVEDFPGWYLPAGIVIALIIAAGVVAGVKWRKKP